MEQKSIIGCGYVPLDVKAKCLKTKTEAKLGIHTYRIISDPYEGVLVKRVCPPFSPLEEYRETRYKAMAVNILDPRTGLTYAVEYHPANLVRENAESPQAAASESSKMDSAAYIEKIISYAEALNKIAKDNPEIGNDCGVLLIFGRINENEKSCAGGGFVGGNSCALRIGLEKACRRKPKVYPLLAKVVENVASKKAFDLALRLGDIVCEEDDK